jgi:[acyl-carrier-protein] S-malonyltransferase
MLADYANEASVQDCFTEASEALGLDLWDLSQNDEARLSQTEFTQPALLTASVALYRLWLARGGAAPKWMAGHSLGEYSALTCAGALELAAAVRLVNARGRCMQNAVPAGVGAMAAVIGLDDDGVQALCDALAEDDVLAPVNFNSPGQVVVAGHKAAVDRAVAEGKSHGARMVKPLAVSVPSHCALMQEAADTFAEQLRAVALQAPAVPVIHNVSANVATDIGDIETALLQQLYSPVRWVQSMQYAIAEGAQSAVEFGPGAVLQGLNKRIKKDWPQAGTATADKLEAALTA